jgi:hypothetical protein
MSEAVTIFTYPVKLSIEEMQTIQSSLLQGLVEVSLSVKRSEEKGAGTPEGTARVYRDLRALHRRFITEEERARACLARHWSRKAKEKKPDLSETPPSPAPLIGKVDDSKNGGH